MPTLLHITTPSQWHAAKTAGVYQGDTLAIDGFIHASFPHQVLAVAQRYYHGRSDLVLLVHEASIWKSTEERGVNEYDA